MGKSWERCEKECWGVGEIGGRSVGIWKSVGGDVVGVEKCWVRCGKVFWSVGKVGEMWGCGKVCWYVWEVGGDVGRCWEKCEVCWGVGEVRGEWGCGKVCWGVGRCRKMCWGVGEVWESVLVCVGGRGRCGGVGRC